jgi:hypothetical protein
MLDLLAAEMRIAMTGCRTDEVARDLVAEPLLCNLSTTMRMWRV